MSEVADVDGINDVPNPPIPQSWKGEPRIAVFFIPASDSVPLPDRSTYTFWREERVDWLKGVVQAPTQQAPPFARHDEMNGYNWVTFKVWRPKEELRMTMEPFDRALSVMEGVVPNIRRAADETPELDSISLDAESFSTVLEANTPLLPVWQEGELDLAATVDDAFDRCMENLSELVRSYIVVSKDLRVGPPTRNTLFFVLPWTTRNPEGSEWGGLGLYKPNTGVGVLPTPTGVLNKEQMNAIMVAVSRLKRRDPMSVFAQRGRASARAFRISSDYSATVIEAHISGEVLFDAVLLMMAWEEGTAPEEAAGWFDEGLSKRLRTHYAPRLGGNWNTQDPNGVIGHWARCVRDIRNRVVHQGYWPTEAEAYESLRVTGEVEDFVKGRMAVKRNLYARAALLVLGRPGLERLGLYAGKIKKFAETTAAEERDWLQAYGDWAEAFEVARSSRG